MIKDKHGYVLVSALIIVLAFVVGLGTYIATKENDSPVEQAAEAVLKAQGIDVDLSPEDQQ